METWLVIVEIPSDISEEEERTVYWLPGDRNL